MISRIQISPTQPHTTDCINIATPYILHQCNISIYIIVTPYRHHVWSYTYFYMHMLAITPPYGESIYIVHSRTSLVTTQCSAMATTARLNMMMFWMIFIYIYMASWNTVSIGPGYDLLPVGTKSLPKPMLTYRQLGPINSSLPWTKWPLFCRRYIQMHFREWKVWYVD